MRLEMAAGDTLRQSPLAEDRRPPMHVIGFAVERQPVSLKIPADIGKPRASARRQPDVTSLRPLRALRARAAGAQTSEPNMLVRLWNDLECGPAVAARAVTACDSIDRIAVGVDQN